MKCENQEVKDIKNYLIQTQKYPGIKQREGVKMAKTVGPGLPGKQW